MKKNEPFTMIVEDMSENGEGIGHVNGHTLFVKDAVIGDEIEGKVTAVKKNLCYGRLTGILKASESRIKPPCPVASPCGGCQLQAMDYAAQLAFKEKKVRAHLERIGHFTDPPMEPILGMEGEPFRYRNKAQYPIGRNREGKIIAGFYAGRTHSIIPCEDCLLGPAENRQILDLVIRHMEKYGIEPYDEEKGTGLLRHVLIRTGKATGEIMVCLICNGKRLPAEKELTEALFAIPGMTSVTLNINRKKTNVILGEELRLLGGRDYIRDRIGSCTFRISPLSFFQVNPAQTVKLYGKALEFAGLTGKETVWDLYCGTGTISLFLAQNAGKVYGVEIVPAAIENARENARENGIENARFLVGRSEEVFPAFYRETGERADVVVVDPPRKGCGEELLATLLAMSPDRIVYVSCDSATLARDLRILCDGGYELKRVQPCDMFPQTVAVETVCLLSNRKPDSYWVAEASIT